ncbi:MAG: MarR family transcriptional regulator [Sphingorhabdus sp.]|uniref:MarR family winged helix-turn-helix transcriptional regulator n=1 Tax=Sphingorhabdus sp. TaxID=1902408 RepID=UPI003C973832
MTSDPLAFEFFNEIGIIDQLIGTMLTNALPTGMTKAQFTVLNHFVRLGLTEKSPADLASAFQVRRPTITSTLARMENAGLVSIRADPRDARGKLVSLTPAGRDMRERCITALGSIAPALEPIIADAEMQALLPTLRKLRVGLDKLRD